MLTSKPHQTGGRIFTFDYTAESDPVVRLYATNTSWTFDIFSDSNPSTNSKLLANNALWVMGNTWAHTCATVDETGLMFACEFRGELVCMLEPIL